MTRHAHVVGAGLAGLRAALDLTAAGWRVTVHEATPKPGGRCRSYDDAALDRRVDNGNHLILSGNAAVLAHAGGLGAGHRLETLPEAAFPFVDLADGGRWTVRVPSSPLAAWRRDARPPGASLWDALRGVAGLMAAGRGRTVAAAVADRGPMWRAFWEPMATAVLNAPPEVGSALLLRAALRRSFLRGAAACRPVLAPEGLGAALIDPAVARLGERGAELRFRSGVEGIGFENGAVRTLAFGGGPEVRLGPGDAVVLAVPPAALAALVPGLAVPGPGPAILNAHFRVDPALAGRAPPLLGVLGAQTQWVFRRGDVLSVTVSAAEGTAVWAMEREAALSLLWAEAARALALGDARPLAARLLRERWATFDQSPAGAARRPATRTGWRNLVLAGDHVATGLPATLEGAVLSGSRAAAALGPA